jgi:signal transduction histidine kinase
MSDGAIRVVLVESNPRDFRLLHEMLREEGSSKTELRHFGCMNDALDYLTENTAQVILLDPGLPDSQGLGAVRQVRSVAPGTPLVLLVGVDDEALAAQALKEGAQDCLIKGQLEFRELLRTVRYAIERQRMQVETDQVRRLQLKLKDEFLSHVSHELRSPLTAIHQFATILADELSGGVNAEQRECLQVVLRNVGQLRAMIGDLLEVTRAQEGRLSVDLQCASVPDAIADSVQTLQGTARDKEVVLSYDAPPPLPLAYADPTRLRQILIILLDNAVKFTGPEGVVTVRTRLYWEDPNFLYLEVADSGCGISADMTERIFERLSQCDGHCEAGRKGLGLGLYICKELVVRQGGRIWVNSTLKQGSIFSLILPVYSLARLLAPLLKNEVWPADSVALVTVEIVCPNGWPSKELREECSRDARDLLQRCLLPDLDVLLPRMGSGTPVELFHAVSFADERGVAVLTKRIREQFRRLKQFGESGLTLATSFKLLDRGPATANSPWKDPPEEMAARIEELIQSQGQARTVPS